MQLMGSQITADTYVFDACLFDLALPDELSWRVGHECSKTDEQDDTPRDLDPKWKTPLQGSVRRIAASHADPVGHHSSERDAATGNAADESTMFRAGDLAQVDGYCRHHTTDSCASYSTTARNCPS